MIPRVNAGYMRRQLYRNIVAGVFILGAMLAVLGICAWMLGGWQTLAITAVFVALGIFPARSVPPELVMRASRARPVDPRRLPDVSLMLARLAKDAGLARVPALYISPDPSINAFTVGTPTRAAIAISAGAFQQLGLAEIRGILAHEVCHIAAGDTGIVRLTELVVQTTLVVVFLALSINLVVVVMTGSSALPLGLAFFAAVAPLLMTLLQLALSRNREFAADLGTVWLTGDPLGLLSALDRIERQRGRWAIFQIQPDLSGNGLERLLRTHPSLRERKRRLIEALDLHDAPNRTKAQGRFSSL